ncbi:MAG: hypothetical protein WAU31_02165 [Candidatus Moraniibacteriota bacterium]
MITVFGEIMNMKMWLSQSSRYLILLAKNWILWLFVLLDIIGVIVQFVIPNFQLPAYSYGTLAIIGFLWAGMQVFNQTVESYEGTISDYRTKMAKLSDALDIDAILDVQNISISLIEGHEYRYFMGQYSSDSLGHELLLRSNSTKEQDTGSVIDEPIVVEQSYFVPNSFAEFYLRIENLGCSVDILIIEIEIKDYYQLPFNFGLARINVEDQEVVYPVHLKPRQSLQCTARHIVSTDTHRSQARFASMVKDFRDEPKYTQQLIVSLESVDPAGERKRFEVVAKMSIRPLIEAYLLHWKEKGQSELIRLAGGM